MGLSPELISQFAKVVNNDKKQNTESTIYGTVVDQHGRKPGDVDSDGNEIVIDEEGGKYIKPDGSDQLIPITENDDDIVKGSTITNTNYGDRASVLIKNHTATVTGNISAPSASNKDVETKINEYDVIIAKQIQADKAYLQKLIADEATIGQLTAAGISVTELLADSATVQDLIAGKITVTDLIANKIDADVVEANYATIKSLEATDAKIGSVTADVAHINTLMFGTASGDVLQTNFANAVIALLGDAQIKSAMIESLNASKINAGSVNTNNVKIESTDGKLVISDNTIQISDDKRVRVQIGKDASNDYSISIWDADGNLMFSEGGITDAAIKEAIIRNDMVSDDANIDAKKLNIDSLFTEINGSTNTIKSTKVYFDSQKQTLDMAFNEMNTTVTEQGETIESQGTDISVIQGQIGSKIWQQDIDTATNEQNTKYSELEQTLKGFKTEVSETYSTKDELQNLEIGGRNLIKFDQLGTSSCFLSGDSTSNIEVYNVQPSAVSALTISGSYEPGEYTLNATCNVNGENFRLLSSSAFEEGFTYNQYYDEHVGGRAYYKAVELPITFTLSEDTIFGLVMTSGNSTHLITGLKLEKGSKATDWTPAPEDMVTNAELNVREESLRSSIAGVEQTANEVKLKVNSVETLVNNNKETTDGEINRIQQEVEAKVSKDGFEVSVQKIIQATGASSVDTGTGYKFGADGFIIDKQDYTGNIIGDTNTKINHEGMTVNDSSIGDPNKAAVLTANKNGVNAKNLHATTYLIIGKDAGRSRFEDYMYYDTKRTGCFWIGG
jgi:hypothetical protein